MNLLVEIDALRPDILAGSWGKVEALAGRRCLSVDASAYRGIKSLDLGGYRTQLRTALQEALESALSVDAKAIYWGSM